ncbi:hypothetical protein K431DRAFT_278577 [Polychaeton citri CBS 116435]|uniref:MICOS complex subunit n=1 Tax=Polychaeton citri CBS 116435 TaxID=1314669 RepID=A0A9P4PZF8_9PEZI|nr:hypothetical protein K431DRAFT_278577 [Polychaeton citri CBS 116435]
MAFAPLIWQRAAPLAALTVGAILVPKSTTLAEEPADPLREIRRKPIYSSEPAATLTPTVRQISATTPPPASGLTETPIASSSSPQSDSVSSEVPSSASASKSPSPTDRLAAQIKTTRLALHGYAVSAEDAVNSGMDNILSTEKSFTQTIASLAPPPESNERVLPGGIYVLVAAMAGSIVSRNRGILLRFLTPTVTGVTAAHYILPRTTQNVGDLIWKYEEKYPVVKENHLRVSEGVRHFIETGKAHSQMGLAMAEDKVTGVRESVEDWVKKGR